MWKRALEERMKGEKDKEMKKQTVRKKQRKLS